MNTDSYDTNSSLSPAVGLVVVGIGLLFAVLYLWAFVRILHRSGYSGWWILISLVPLLNVVMFFVFAFKKAPTERELEHLRAMTGRQPQRY